MHPWARGGLMIVKALWMCLLGHDWEPRWVTEQYVCRRCGKRKPFPVFPKIPA